MSRRRGTLLILFLVGSVCAAGLSVFLVFSGALPPAAPPAVEDAEYEPPTLDFDVSRFADVPGWREGAQAGAIAPFLRSCAALAGRPDDAPANAAEALGEAHAGLSLAGQARDWRAACRAALDVARNIADGADADLRARDFFETYFRPVEILSVRAPKSGASFFRRARIERDGLFTGYFEPIYPASLTPTAEYSAPLYQRPDDLVMVDLGAFRPKLAGERIAGYVEAGKLMPYPDHRAIDGGALGARGRVIAWLNPNDLFFLQIQGSGRLRLVQGGEIRVGYDGQNGQPYTPIGKVLIDKGAMRREDVSMQSIRAWLDAAPPDAARGLRETNASYVFFRVLDDLVEPGLGPIGAGGSQLTPERSLAVDRRYYPMGAPVWLSIEASGRDPQMRRLFIAQDAGGAIKGPIRGDVFFGAGDEAGARAGAFRRRGEMFVLVPAPVAARLLLAEDGR